MEKETDQKECRKFFEDWLRAYSEHLHLVRQGRHRDMVQPDAGKHPISVKNAPTQIAGSGKSTNA